MSTKQEPAVSWKSVPTRTVTAGGVEFAYRELGTNNPGTPVVFLVHLAAVLDNWDRPALVENDLRGTRESEHPRMLANGSWPSASSLRGV